MPPFELPLIPANLEPGEVHVWNVALDFPDYLGAALEQTLTSAERDRVRRFRGAGDRRRHAGARGVLRDILSRYIGAAPADVRFQSGQHGQPILDVEAGQPLLRFSFSHSGNLAAIAVSQSCVGIDIEREERDASMDAIAERFFAPSEVVGLRALQPADRSRMFFACWVRKEAVLKALGTGLAVPLDAVEVSVDPLGPAKVVRLNGDTRAAKRWALVDLSLPPGYSGALAAEATGVHLRCLEWKASDRPRPHASSTLGSERLENSATAT